MQNDSYTVEKYYDDLYERPESVSQKECPHCEGTGKEILSECCGAIIIDDKCSDCKNECSTISEDCEECNGEGVVS